MQKSKNKKVEILCLTRITPYQWVAESRTTHFDIRWNRGGLYYGKGKSSLAAELDLEFVGEINLPTTQEVIELLQFDIAPENWIEYD